LSVNPCPWNETDFVDRSDLVPCGQVPVIARTFLEAVGV
jgi:hypothetical protein